MQIELPACRRDRIPDLYRVFPVHPDFIAQISGISGARNVNRHASDFARGHAEVFQISNFRLGYGLQQFGGSWPL